MVERRNEPLRVAGPGFPDRRGRRAVATILVTTDLATDGLAERSSRYVDIFEGDSAEVIDAKIARASAMILDAVEQFGADRVSAKVVDSAGEDPDGH